MTGLLKATVSVSHNIRTLMADTTMDWVGLVERQPRTLVIRETIRVRRLASLHRQRSHNKDTEHRSNSLNRNISLDTVQTVRYYEVPPRRTTTRLPGTESWDTRRICFLVRRTLSKNRTAQRACDHRVTAPSLAARNTRRKSRATAIASVE